MDEFLLGGHPTTSWVQRVGVAVLGSAFIAYGRDSQGWNEQPPGSDSGSSDPGTLFGSGNTSPFVFSFQNQSFGDYLRSYWSSAGFLGNFLTGTGPISRYDGPQDYRTRDLMSSGGFQRIVNPKIAAACQAGATSGRLNPGTGEAAGEIPFDIFHSLWAGRLGDTTVGGASAMELPLS